MMPQMKKILKGTLRSRAGLGGGYHLLEFDAPGLAEGARPGQFVMVRAGSTHHPILPRPFSILDAEGASLRLLIKAVGEGTRLITEMAEGDATQLMGPLGNAFPAAPATLLVAGGYGMAPLFFYARRHPDPGALHLFYGARTAEHLLLLDRWRALLPEDNIHLATEDGSLGARGLVTAPLERHLKECPGAAPLLACGPTPMMKASAAAARAAERPCFVSMDEPMACGFGICLGCVVPATEGGYVCSCTEGPVFDAAAIRWEAL
jgi:dihydroorotate dehydrogenase electron transfer subunit